MTPNQIIWKLWDSAIGKVAPQDCQNHDQRHYGENRPMAIFNSSEANNCCKLLNLSYWCMILLLGGRYLHQCRKSSNAALLDRTDDHTGQVNKEGCVCCYLIAVGTKRGACERSQMWSCIGQMWYLSNKHRNGWVSWMRTKVAIRWHQMSLSFTLTELCSQNRPVSLKQLEQWWCLEHCLRASRLSQSVREVGTIWSTEAWMATSLTNLKLKTKSVLFIINSETWVHHYNLEI